MRKCRNCEEDPCICLGIKRTQTARTKPWEEFSQGGGHAPEDWFVRRAIRRWAAQRTEAGRMDRGKSIADLVLEEFIADGGGPDHPDYLRLEEFMQRNAEQLKVKS